MGIHKIYLHYIIAAICSTVLLGACAPQQTGDLDTDHRPAGTAELVPGHEPLDTYSALPEPTIDEYLEGRLQGDVEPEPEQTCLPVHRCNVRAVNRCRTQGLA